MTSTDSSRLRRFARALARVARAIFTSAPCPDCAKLPEGDRCEECMWFWAIK
jgi:recombinational DNA repair protein RecR